MSLTCPSCGNGLSIFGLKKEAFSCPHCGVVIQSKVPPFTYILFRLLAGGVALTIADPFVGCQICFYSVMLFIIVLIAYAVVRYGTEVKIVDSRLKGESISSDRPI